MSTLLPFSLDLTEPAIARPARPVLEDGYHLAHFKDLLAAVLLQYRPLLNFAERRYLKTVERLSPDALSLYVRLLNRKGPAFRTAKLNYLPPVSLHNALGELTRQKLLAPVTDGADCDALLALFTLPELRAHLSQHVGKASPAPKAPRQSLCDWLTAQADWNDFAARLLADHAVVTIVPGPWEFLKFLYFGQLVANLSDFVLHDLNRQTGQWQTETIDGAHLAPRFTTRAEAVDCYKTHLLYDAFRAVRDAPDPAGLVAWWQSHDPGRAALHPAAYEMYDRLVAKLGRLLERHKEHGMAISIYRDSPGAARERLVKLLLRVKECDASRDEAMALLADGLQSPRDAEEAYALQQIWNRLHTKSRAGDAARALKDCPAVELDWAGTTVEQAALDHYKSQGWQGLHSENWLWRNLFGLVFWDMIFDASQGGFHNALQTSPSDLFKPGFFSGRMDRIGERLAVLHDRGHALQLVRDRHAQKQNIANPFVAWHPDTLMMMEILLTHINPPGLCGVLQHMAHDLGVGCHGFPDLFLWREDDGVRAYRFVEVKSTTDRILPQQFNWLQVFRTHGVKAGVLRVNKPAE